MTTTSGVISMNASVLNSPRRPSAQASNALLLQSLSPSKASPAVTSAAGVVSAQNVAPANEVLPGGSSNPNDPEEVRKLREIIRRLEQQNQILLSNNSPAAAPQTPTSNNLGVLSPTSPASNNSMLVLSPTSSDRSGLLNDQQRTQGDNDTNQASSVQSTLLTSSAHRTPGGQTPRQGAGKSRGTSRTHSRSISPSRLQEALRGRGASANRSSRSSDDEDFLDELDELRITDADENDDSWLVPPASKPTAAASAQAKAATQIDATNPITTPRVDAISNSPSNNTGSNANTKVESTPAKSDPFSWMNEEFERAKREKERAESAEMAEERSLMLARLSLSAQKPAAPPNVDAQPAAAPAQGSEKQQPVRRGSFVIDRRPGEVLVPQAAVPRPVASNSSPESAMVSARRQLGGSMTILPQKAGNSTAPSTVTKPARANAVRSSVANVSVNAAPIRSGLTPRAAGNTKPTPVRAVHGMVGTDYDPSMTIYPSQPISNELRRSMKLLGGSLASFSDPNAVDDGVYYDDQVDNSGMQLDGEAQAYMIATGMQPAGTAAPKPHSFAAPSAVAPSRRAGQTSSVAQSNSFQSANRRGMTGSFSNVNSTISGAGARSSSASSGSSRLGPSAKVSSSMANLNATARPGSGTMTRNTAVRQSIGGPVTQRTSTGPVKATTARLSQPGTVNTAKLIPAGTTMRATTSAGSFSTNRSSTSNLARTQSQAINRSSMNVRMNTQPTNRPVSAKQQPVVASTTSANKRQTPVRATSTYNMASAGTNQTQATAAAAARRTGQPIKMSPQQAAAATIRSKAGNGSMMALTPTNNVANAVNPNRTHTVQNNGYMQVLPNNQYGVQNATMTPIANSMAAMNRPGTVTRQQGPSTLLATGAVRSFNFDLADEDAAMATDMNANRVIPVSHAMGNEGTVPRRSGIPFKGSFIPNMTRPAAPIPQQSQFQPISAEDDFY